MHARHETRFGRARERARSRRAALGPGGVHSFSHAAVQHQAQVKSRQMKANTAANDRGLTFATHHFRPRNHQTWMHETIERNDGERDARGTGRREEAAIVIDEADGARAKTKSRSRE